MQTNSRNNGNRARGQRIMTTIKMNARDAAEWKIKLIITHLYGIMELLSRDESRARGALLHASWPTIRGSITMENGNGEPGEERHQVLANGDLTGDMN